MNYILDTTGFHVWTSDTQPRRTGPVWADAFGSEHYVFGNEERRQSVSIASNGQIRLYGHEATSLNGNLYG